MRITPAVLNAKLGELREERTRLERRQAELRDERARAARSLAVKRDVQRLLGTLRERVRRATPQERAAACRAVVRRAGVRREGKGYLLSVAYSFGGEALPITTDTATRAGSNREGPPLVRSTPSGR